MQLPLFADNSKSAENIREFKVLHYLGSKFRLLRPIHQAVASVLPPGGRICDLFSGSGTVSLSLSGSWVVTAVDIQEYARVLANGILNPPVNTPSLAREIRNNTTESSLWRELTDVFEDLICYEQKCLEQAIQGQVGSFCDLLEDGSLYSFNHNGRAQSNKLQYLMERASTKLSLNKQLMGPQSVVTRHFGGVYFSWKQAIFLDSLLAQVHTLNNQIRDHFLAAVLAAASNVVCTVGKHFAQPIKPYGTGNNPKHHIIGQALRDRSMSVLDSFETWIQRFNNLGLRRSKCEHRAIRADYRDILSDKNFQFDAVYADPPYTRDHYSRYYHVLETMSLRDDPEVSTTKIHAGKSPRVSRGIYRVDRYQSPFCIKSKAASAFEELCNCVSNRHIPLVISYSPYKQDSKNRPRLLSVDELLEIASRHFSKVGYIPVANVSHSKFNLVARNVEVRNHAEIIVSCLP